MTYSNVHFDRRKSEIHLWSYNDSGHKEHTIKPAPLYFYSENSDGDYTTIDGRKAKRINCKTHREFKEKIAAKKSIGIETFESDVSIETKFIVGEYLGQSLPIPEFDIHYFDIEVQSDEGFPIAEEANYPVVAITVWSTKKQKFTIFAEKEFDDSFMSESTEEYEIIIDNDESQLLKKYIKWIFDEDPDILSGWNSNGFDIPYLVNRISKLLGSKWVNRLSPINKVTEYEIRISDSRHEKRYNIAGRSCLDLLEVYKNYTFQERENYRLGTVTKVELGDDITKNEYEGSISDFYHDDWDGYMKYNIQDTRLLKLLEDKLGYIKMLINFCYGCRVPFQQYMKTTRVLDGAFIAELTKDKIVVPDVNRDLKDVSYPGGFVAEPDRGIHSWVFSFDARSLYPSIMMGWNISPEMKVAVLNKKSVENIYNCWTGYVYDDSQILNFNNKSFKVDDFCDYVRESESLKIVNELGGFHEIANGDAVREIMKCLSSKKYRNMNVSWNDEVIDVETVASRIKEGNYCLCSNGVIYDQHTVGVIPRFVRSWFNKRREFKELMIEKEKEAAQYKDRDKIKYENLLQDAKYYNLLQLNYKILINSVYGYLGTVYSRFYDFDNCVAVTITGQSITKTVKNSLDQFFLKKFPESKLGKKYNATPIENFVIYGDTDSVYLNFGKLLKSIGYKYDKKDDDVVKNFLVYNLPKKNQDIFGIMDSSGQQIGGLPKIERDDLEQTQKTLQNYVSSFINSSMVDFTKNKCNCKENEISFKREVVASSGIFIMRKRYVLRSLNSEGVEMDKVKATGIELVRSSTPVLVQAALKRIIYKILKTLDFEEIEKELREFRSMFFKAAPHDIGRPTSVNKYDTYAEKMDNGNFVSIPGHVKASYFYNKLLDENPKICTTYNRIYNGSKVKIVYLKQGYNQKLNAIAFEYKLPTEFNLHEYVDYKTQFNKVFESGLKTIYETIGWEMPNLETVSINSLFEW